MRKEVFVVLFLLVVLAFFYSPPSEGGVYLLGCGDSSGGGLGCEPDRELEITEGENCFAIENVNELYGEVPASVQSVDLPANYFYEGFLTNSRKPGVDIDIMPWKFRVQGDDIEMLLPQLAVFTLPSSSKVVTLNVQPAIISPPTANCQAHYFNFQRGGGVELDYRVPLLRSETMPNGAPRCVYNSSIIQSDLFTLGINAQVCPDLVSGGREIPLGSQCSEFPTADCSVDFPLGEKSYYLVYLEKDSCGNRIISEGENGREFTQQEFDSGAMRAIADSWVDSCSSKYEQRVVSVEAKLNLDSFEINSQGRHLSYLEYLQNAGKNVGKFVELANVGGRDFQIISPDAGFTDVRDSGIVCEADVTTNLPFSNSDGINVQFNIVAESEILAGANQGTEVLSSEIVNSDTCIGQSNNRFLCMHKIPRDLLERAGASNRNIRCEVQAVVVGGSGEVKFATSQENVFNRICEYDNIVLNANVPSYNVCQYDIYSGVREDYAPSYDLPILTIGEDFLSDVYNRDEVYDCYPKIQGPFDGKINSYLLVPYASVNANYYDDVQANFFTRTRENPLQCYGEPEFVGLSSVGFTGPYCFQAGEDQPEVFYTSGSAEDWYPEVYYCGLDSISIPSEGFDNLAIYTEVYSGGQLLFTSGSFNTGLRITDDSNFPPGLMVSSEEEASGVLSNVEFFFNEGSGAFEFKVIPIDTVSGTLGAGYDDLNTIQDKTSLVIEDFESEFSSLKFSLGDNQNSLPPVSAPNNGIINYVPLNIDSLLSNTNYLTSGITKNVYLKVCDDGATQDGVEGPPECSIKLLRPKLKPSETLRRVKFAGSINNIVPFVGGVRSVGDVSMNYYIIEDPLSLECGEFRANSAVKAWFHGDLYDAGAYDSLIQSEPGDLFDKTMFFPHKDSIGSFVWLIETSFEDGVANFKVTYKEVFGEQAESMSLAGVRGFDLAGGTVNEDSVQLDGSNQYNDAEYQLKRKLMRAIFGLYSNYLGVDVDIFGAIEANVLESLDRKPSDFIELLLVQDLADPAKSSRDREEYPLPATLPWDIHIQPIIDSAIEQELNMIRNNCNEY